MLPITKPESLELLEFSKLPFDIIQGWHNYINKYLQITFSHKYMESIILFRDIFINNQSKSV